jgi:choline dehydrogenase
MLSKLLFTASFAVRAIATKTDAAEYDYVIVGSGPGGGSLA